MNDDFEVRFVWCRALAMLVLVVAVCLTAADLIALLLSNNPFFLDALPYALFASLFSGVFYALVRLLISVEAQVHHVNERLARVIRGMDDLLHAVNLASENILLSEEAKSIAFREKDREALRGAIEEEINKRDWESAFYLADQLERLFGYRAEAAQLRARINRARDQSKREKLQADLARLEDLFAAHDWENAARQIDTLQKTYPDQPQVANLRDRLEESKLQHKKNLLQRWDQAVNRNDIDGGIEILKELDQYLTPNEVAALEESARGVFRAKLHNMGVRFSMLVAEKQWAEALQVGREIIEEFPNSRMADEIRERLDVLQARAADAHEVS